VVIPALFCLGKFGGKGRKLGTYSTPIFYGSFTYKLDDKDRLSIPSDYRDQMSDAARNTIVVTVGMGKCLSAYPLDGWLEVIRNLNEMNLPPEKLLKFSRKLLSKSVNCTLDGQGRIRIPKNLMEDVGLKKEVKVVGMLDRLELWNPDLHEEYEDTSDAEFQDTYMKVFIGSRGKRTDDDAKSN
jgi:MraZ protein